MEKSTDKKIINLEVKQRSESFNVTLAHDEQSIDLVEGMARLSLDKQIESESVYSEQSHEITYSVIEEESKTIAEGDGS